MVFLLPQADASKAIAATPAIKEEGAVVALLAELAFPELKALLAIGAFVTALALMNLRTINACFTLVCSIAVDGILVMIRFDRKVTVLAPSALVHVFAVLQSGDIERYKRDHAHELRELFEEWAREIKIPSVIERVVRVLVPFLIVEDLIRMIRRKDGENIFPREITFTHVEIPFNPPRKPSL